MTSLPRRSDILWATAMTFAAYVAGDALVLFVLRQFAFPRVMRLVEKHERARDELRQRLGREPTDDELFEHLVD